MSIAFPKHHFTDSGSLAGAIRDRDATVAVVGMGYVGLPLAIALDRAGFEAIGFDANESKVESLSSGTSHVTDIADATLGAGAIRFTASPRPLREADVIVVAVPTPLTDGIPDLAMVRDACTAVAEALRPGMLVILESTTWPGTTEEVVLPILESSGLLCGEDFFLGYSPERIDPGSDWSLADTPKVVSGVGDEAGDLVELFYRQIVREVVRVPSPREAEMAKLIENTFRHVNIALVNELAMLAPHLGVDIWSALDAAATKPFGYLPFWPGPGVGGHCIAIDPSYLSWRVSQRLGFGVRFVEHAMEVNNRMPAYVASRVAEALNESSKPVRGSRLMVLGIAYKPGVNDMRESPALSVLRHLATAGASVSYHDPYVQSIDLEGTELLSQPLSEELLESQDCVIILTAHPGIDYEAITKVASLVFDARGVTRWFDAPNAIRL
jgi:UDP-N-acetyl-D-glucosamine dehydrogenase